MSVIKFSQTVRGSIPLISTTKKPHDQADRAVSFLCLEHTFEHTVQNALESITDSVGCLLHFSTHIV